MQMEPLILPKLLQAVSDPKEDLMIQYVRLLYKQLKYTSEEATKFLKETMISITNILKDPNIHPKVKYSSHRMIMYLIFMADPEIYQHFSNSIYPVLRANCSYNKAGGIEVRGEDFFKQSKCKTIFLYFVVFTNPSTTAAEKVEIKKYGSLYILFSLETVFKMAQWLPYDLEDDTKPTVYSISYQNLLKSGVDFPNEENLKFYSEDKIEQKQKIIKEIEAQFTSLLSSQTNRSGAIQGHKKMDPNHYKVSSVSNLKIVSNQHPLNTEYKNLLRGSLSKPNPSMNAMGNLSGSALGQIDQMYIQSKSKIFLLQDEKNKLLKQIDIQRNFYEAELQKERRIHQENILKYQKKITKLEDQIEKLRIKISSGESRDRSEIPSAAFNNTNMVSQAKSNERAKDKIIEELQNSNKNLIGKIRVLEQQIRKYEALKKVGSSPNYANVNQANINESASVMSVQIQKLKKQNKSLKAKLLTECSQASQFSTKSNTKTQNSEREPQSLKFLGSEDSRSCFEPFYSNSSSQIKIRLRKAILREKQLLYRDKNIQIGCITKLQGINSIRLITVFTNISEKPLFNFAIDFVSREDIVIKMIQNTKNYLQISGQTKSQVYISINQIDFRCLLCSIRYNIQQQTQKTALIMPISKLKLATQLVYTPIKKSQKLKKIEKLFQSDKKILPNLHKFKDYFDLALLEVDRTLHETYYLKMMFMGIKLYVQCDQVQGQLRIAIKYYEDEEYSRAEKLLEELGFLFGKG